MATIERVFLFVSVLSPLVPLWSGRNDRSSLLWRYVILGLFFDIIINMLRRGLEWNHYWAANLFVLLEFVVVSTIYMPILFRKKNVVRQTFFVVAILYFIIGTIAGSVWKFNTSGASFFYFVYIVYAIVGFYRLLTDQQFLFLEKSRLFWMHCAFLIYGSGNFLLFLFTDYLIAADGNLFKMLWATFFLVINTALNVLLAVALSKRELANEPG